MIMLQCDHLALIADAGYGHDIKSLPVDIEHLAGITKLSLLPINILCIVHNSNICQFDCFVNNI